MKLVLSNLLMSAITCEGWLISENKKDKMISECPDNGRAEFRNKLDRTLSAGAKK